MDLQDWIAVGIVVGCAFYLARIGWKTITGSKSACDCPTQCGSKPGVQIVEIGPLKS